MKLPRILPRVLTLRIGLQRLGHQINVPVPVHPRPFGLARRTGEWGNCHLVDQRVDAEVVAVLFDIGLDGGARPMVPTRPYRNRGVGLQEALPRIVPPLVNSWFQASCLLREGTR